MRFFSIFFIAIVALPVISYAQAGGPNPIDKGKQLLEQGNYEAAIQQFGKALESGKSDSVYLFRATAYYGLSLKNKKSSAIEKALDDVNQALAINEKYPDAYFQRGLITKATAEGKNTAEAIQLYLQARNDFVRSIAADPTFTKAQPEIDLIDRQLPELKGNNSLPDSE